MFHRRLIHYFVLLWNSEHGGVGFLAVQVENADDLFASAWVIVFEDQVDLEVFGVPVIVGDGDVFSGSAEGGGDGALFAGAAAG